MTHNESRNSVMFSSFSVNLQILVAQEYLNSKLVRPTTIAKSEIREFGFFRNHECRKTSSTTSIGNPLIREVGYTIVVGSGCRVVGTWNEKLDFTAYSGFFVFFDRHN